MTGTMLFFLGCLAIVLLLIWRTPKIDMRVELRRMAHEYTLFGFFYDQCGEEHTNVDLLIDLYLELNPESKFARQNLNLGGSELSYCIESVEMSEREIA